MSDVNHISRDVLIKSIREILQKADLNVMTPKLVRDELQIRLNVNGLNSRKKEINSIIMEVINDLNNSSNNNNDDCNQNNSSKTSQSISEDYEQAKANKSRKSDKESDDESSSSSSSSSSSDESIDDEELAQRLQKEEIGSKLRATRGNKSSNNKKKTTASKSKKKRKNDSPDEEKTEKKRKNGYLKPCTLSPELAHFLGESEMPRHEVVKRIWSYVKEKNLLDPKNKQFAIADNELLKIFGNRKRFKLFGMMKHLTKHLK